MQFQQQKWLNDPRSTKFSHDKLFGTVTNFPPEGLKRPLRPRENQGNTLRCTAYASAVNGAYIWGQRFSPEWQAKKISLIQGRDIDLNGADPNSTMKSQRDYGYAPYDFHDDNVAYDNRVAGYVKVDGPLDVFDDIRSALFQAYNKDTKEGAVVQAFGRWMREWDAGIIPQNYSTMVGYHCYLFVDWTVLNGTPYLIAQNSYGNAYGEDGIHYFPREVVNREFTLSGTSLKIVKPLTRAQIEEAKKDTPLGNLWKQIILIWRIFSNKYGLYAY